MAKRIKLIEHHSEAELAQAIKECADPAEKNRIRAIINIKKDKTHREVAKFLYVSPDSVTSWVKMYNQKGLLGLKTNKGGRPGGNPKWDVKIFNSLVKEIDKQKKYWSVPVMQEWIRKKFKKEIPEQTVWYHLKGQNYSYKSARPHPYKGDLERQASFKRGASQI